MEPLAPNKYQHGLDSNGTTHHTRLFRTQRGESGEQDGGGSRGRRWVAALYLNLASGRAGKNRFSVQVE